jgi:subtilase family serine protease
MRHARIRRILVGVTTVTVAAIVPLSATVSASAATNSGASAGGTRSQSSNVRDACGTPAPGYAQCFAQVRTDIHDGKGVRGAAARAAGKSAAAAALPAGYGPADLRSAYNLPATGGASQTVAVVDAGDDATAEADLAVYRATYGLPACTTANGCFTKVNQSGQASPLPPDAYWDTETSLDLDMVSAACPDCHILLVESDDATLGNLAASVNTAVSLGATEVSNSYGSPEENGIQAYEADYSHPGVAITVSSGDSGYGIPSFPADLTSVIAVGGTSLTRASNARGWTETAWGDAYGGAGSGCSAWIDKPSWQTDPNCPGRMVADVAADADPATGLAVYDTDNNEPGWLVVGGTSASSPFIAGVIALAGNPAQYPNASYFYSHASELYDVTGGNNVTQIDCGGDYQCNAVPGYDGPTGNGTPDGLAAF